MKVDFDEKTMWKEVGKNASNFNIPLDGVIRDLLDTYIYKWVPHALILPRIIINQVKTFFV